MEPGFNGKVLCNICTLQEAGVELLRHYMPEKDGEA